MGGVTRTPSPGSPIAYPIRSLTPVGAAAVIMWSAVTFYAGLKKGLMWAAIALGNMLPPLLEFPYSRHR